jgi:integrase
MAIQSLTRDELRRVLEQAWAHRKRDWLMFLVAFNHGLRASEVIAITRDDVRDGFLDVQRLKGSQRTVQPLIEDADGLFSERDALIEYANAYTGNQPLFGMTRQHFARLFKRYATWAGIPAHKCHPHVLKHTIAMQVIHSAGIEHTRQYLGHKSLNSTGEYLKVTDEQASNAVRNALRD